MCVLCQAGPEILMGVPAAGLVVARLRARYSGAEGDRPDEDLTDAHFDGGDE